MERPRLIPAVVLGALLLLALKVFGWVHGAPVDTAPETAQAGAKAEYSGFVKIMAKARAPYVVPDPETTGSVAAKEKKPDPKKEAEEKEAAARAADPRNRAPAINAGERTPSAAEQSLLERLGERRDELDSRAKELELREKLLETAEKKIDGKADDLRASQEKASETKEQAAASGGVKSLVVMYEGMKPKDAARVFDRLNLDVLLTVVQAMNPRKMSEILAAMSPEAAEKLTVALASRGKPLPAPAAAAPGGLPGGELPALAPARPPRG